MSRLEQRRPTKPHPHPRPRWSAQTKWTVSMLLLAFVVYLVFRFSEIIPPLVLALVLAYVISPLVKWVERRAHIGRGWAAALVYLALLAATAGLFAVLVPMLINQVTTLNLDLQNLLDESTTWLTETPPTIFGYTIDGATVISQIEGALQTLVSVILGQGLSVAVGVVSALVWGTFIVVISFYLVKDGDMLRDYVEGLVPPAYRADYIYLRTEIGEVWSAFFRGQVVLAGVVTVIITVLALILGLPGALPMGVLAGILEFLPSIGHGIWLSIAATLALLFGSS